MAMYVAARTDAAVSGSAALAQVASNGAPVSAPGVPHEPVSTIVPENGPENGPLGQLEIPSIDLRTALYPDTSEINLNRGAGLIRGMARPGEGGNLGVAAHRDGIFRPLERIEVGAEIEVSAGDARYVYRVTSITVVDRADAALLRRTAEPSITLVTCYPFRFVGPAPRRFVVRGQLT
jgi:sortase A